VNELNLQIIKISRRFELRIRPIEGVFCLCKVIIHGLKKMIQNNTEISQRIKDTIEQLGYLLIDIDFRGDANNVILEIYIDSEEGILTSDCVEVSRVCGDMIEEENLIESKYRLDVSSPGIDRPLKYLQQYPKNINRFFELEFENQVAEKFEGKLLSINNETLNFEINKKTEEVNIKNIKSAKVLVRF
jgi:ribosome maturation factor RimP